MSDRIIKKIKHICNSVVIASLLTIGNPASIRAAEIKVSSAIFFNFQECIKKANDVVCNGYFFSKNGEQDLSLNPRLTTITDVEGTSYIADSIFINRDWECPKDSCDGKGVTLAQGAKYNTRFIFKNVSHPELGIVLLNIYTYSNGAGEVKVRDFFIKNSRVTPPSKREATKIPPTSTTTTPTPSKLPTTSTTSIPSKAKLKPNQRRRVNSTSVSTNLPQVKAGSFAQLCEQKQSLSVETRHTIDVLLQKVRTDDCTVADRKLTSLTSLSLSRKQIIDLTPLTSLTNLRYLILDRNQIVDVTPLSKLSNLTTIYLRNNQIGNVESLAGLNKLRMLAVSNNQLKSKNCPVKPASICRF